jgi:hypothetical protein
MLANTLVTNEVKGTAGTEIEFDTLLVEGRKRVFYAPSAGPSAPHLLTIQHSETGSGINRRRRSVVRFDKTTPGLEDPNTVMQASCYIVADLPVGNDTTGAVGEMVIANILSFCASLGASTTILYDLTGNGAVCLRQGSL